jgi:hypothetical protein
MADVTSPSSSFDPWETSAQLDRLFQSQNDQRNELMGRLRALVADVPVAGDDDEASLPSRQRGPGPGSGGQRPDPPRFIALPQRTTPGGGFGPAVRSKLIAEARAKRGW